MNRLWPRPAGSAADLLEPVFEELAEALASFASLVYEGLVDEPQRLAAAPFVAPLAVELFGQEQGSGVARPALRQLSGGGSGLTLVVELHTRTERWLRTAPALFAALFEQLVLHWAPGIRRLGADFALRRTEGHHSYNVPKTGLNRPPLAFFGLGADPVLQRLLQWANDEAELPAAAPAAELAALALAWVGQERVRKHLERLDVRCGQRPGLAHALPRLVARLVLEHHGAATLPGPTARELGSLPTGAAAARHTDWWFVGWPDPAFVRTVWWPLRAAADTDRAMSLVDEFQAFSLRFAEKLA